MFELSVEVRDHNDWFTAENAEIVEVNKNRDHYLIEHTRHDSYELPGSPEQSFSAFSATSAVDVCRQ
jgi:hypothetical protein